MAATTTPQQELRRSSRSSALARFAYTGGAAAASTGPASSRGSRRVDAAASARTATATPDIEDVIPDLEQIGSSRKRRRTAATTTTSATTIKTEAGSTTRGTTRTAQSRSTRGALKKEELASDDSDAASPPTPKYEDASEDDFAPSASDTEFKPPTTTSSLPIRKLKRERKPARVARTTTTTSPDTGTSTVTTKILPPSDWEETYTTLVRMRTTPGSPAANAAVDTMGCERLALPTATPRDQRFHTLVALMLSSQTKDTTNAAAMHRLHTELPTAPADPVSNPAPAPGLNLENIIAVAPERLNELIWAVGFHNNKTRYIQSAALICRDAWGGDIPDTFAGLVALPGVGPKMAHLCLSAAWGRTEGIGVDVHVHRISNMWGWLGRKGTKNPEETRKCLEAWLPRDR